MAEPGVVEHGAVLGDDGVEQLQAIADPRQLEEGSPGDEDEAKARRAGPLQRLAHHGRDPVLEREGAIVVAGERLEEHVSSLRASRVPPRKRHRMVRIADPAVRDAGHRRPTVVGIPSAREPRDGAEVAS